MTRKLILSMALVFSSIAAIAADKQWPIFCIRNSTKFPLMWGMEKGAVKGWESDRALFCIDRVEWDYQKHFYVAASLSYPKRVDVCHVSRTASEVSIVVRQRGKFLVCEDDERSYSSGAIENYYPTLDKEYGR